MSEDNMKTWRKLSDIVDQIVATQAEIKAKGGVIVYEPNDREAFDILARIERKILAKGIKKES